MKIKEFLKDYYAEPHFFPKITKIYQDNLNKKLKNDIHNLTKDTPGYGVIFHLTEQYDPSFHPDSLIKICKTIGSDELEDVTTWCNSDIAKNIYSAIKMGIYSLELSNLPEISAADLHRKFNSISNSSGASRVLMDSTYQLVPENKVEYILDTFQGHHKLYIPDVRDCDDFSRIMRGWLSNQGYGNLTIGSCLYIVYDKNDEIVIYHSAICIVTDQNIYIAEPQQDIKFWPIDETSEMYSNAVRTEVIRLVF